MMMMVIMTTSTDCPESGADRETRVVDVLIGEITPLLTWNTRTTMRLLSHTI